MNEWMNVEIGQSDIRTQTTKQTQANSSNMYVIYPSVVWSGMVVGGTISTRHVIH